MSTERKPGSRGVMAPQSPMSETRSKNGVDGGSKRKPKGTTKTASRRQSFKRKPK